MEQMIPLSRLRLSDSNVRKSGRTNIAQLASDIEARGLLQNLLVTALKKPRGHYAVFAGGRRLEALQPLASDGRIGKDSLPHEFRSRPPSILEAHVWPRCALHQ